MSLLQFVGTLLYPYFQEVVELLELFLAINAIAIFSQDE